MSTQNKLTIECRPNPDTKWFRIGTLENASYQEAEKFIQNVIKKNPSTPLTEYRIVES